MIQPTPAFSSRLPRATKRDVPVQQERLVDTFLHLTQIPGQSQNERAVADAIKQEVAALGLQTQEDKAGETIGGNCGNLLVNIPGNVEGAPSLLFASHMDTVPLAVGCKPIVNGDLIRTNGSTALGGDCRAGCSELLEATREILENNLPHGPIQLLFSVGEEKGLLGAYAFDAKQSHSVYNFAVDAFQANEIYVQGNHLEASGVRPTAEQVCQGHQAMHSSPAVPLESLDLSPDEKNILDFTSAAMHDLGWEPRFHRIEWAASDANALRQNGLNAITLGAGENLEHTRGEYVRISDMVKSTQLIRQLVDRAANSAS